MIDLIKRLKQGTAASDQTGELIAGLNEIIREEREKKLITVSKAYHLTDDTCDLGETMTLVKYTTMKPEAYFTERHYERHAGQLHSTAIKTIRPRKFYELREIENFVEHLRKIAGRTLEDAEIKLLLRHITRGEHYDLVCAIDQTEAFENEIVFEDIKK